MVKKGHGVVDIHFSDAATTHVYGEGGDVFNVMLNQVTHRGIAAQCCHSYLCNHESVHILSGAFSYLSKANCSVSS